MSMADQAANNIEHLTRLVRSGIGSVRQSKNKAQRKAAVAALRRQLTDLSYWSAYLKEFATDITEQYAPTTHWRNQG